MEHYWCLIAESLASLGRRTLLAYPRGGAIPETIRQAPIDVRWLDFGDRSAQGWRNLAATVRGESITSLYLTDRAYLDMRYIGLRRLGVESIVLHEHRPGDRPPVRGLKGWVKGRIRNVDAWSADLYVAVSDFVRDRMIENARVPENRTLIVPNGVAPIAYSAEDRSRARMEIGACDDEIVVGMVARAHRIKGIEFAIDVAGKVLEENPQLLFVFIGDGPDLQQFRARAEGRGVTDRFRFLGRRSDARRVMAGFDIGFHPSMAEIGYCLAILELMNAGLPVVVPNRPSVRGATEPGVTGLWYPADDMRACARAILDLASDPDRRASFGRAARERTLTQFSLESADAAFSQGVAGRL
jgi:glycosyltransferase involved in cell wall biosynthesis